MCFFFIYFQCLVHAMDTTPIVKTIQNNGKDCHLFDLVFLLTEKKRFFFREMEFFLKLNSLLALNINASLKKIAFFLQFSILFKITNFFEKKKANCIFMCLFFVFLSLFYFMCVYACLLIKLFLN